MSNAKEKLQAELRRLTDHLEELENEVWVTEVDIRRVESELGEFDEDNE